MDALPSGLARAMRLSEKAGPIRALHIFDFDGTLVRTPDKATGAAIYQRTTGRPWKLSGWWGREESLGPDVVPIPLAPNFVIRTVFSEFEDITLRSQTAAAVVVTGRLSKLRDGVLRILHEAARTHSGQRESFVNNDAVFTHPGKGLSTYEFKTALFEQIILDGPAQVKGVKELHIWEDRTEHARAFGSEFADKMQERHGIKTVIHFVSPELP